MPNKSTVAFTSQRRRVVGALAGSAALATTAAALAAGLGALSARPARAAPGGLTIRFSHVVAEDTPKGLAAERFRALV